MKPPPEVLNLREGARLAALVGYDDRRALLDPESVRADLVVIKGNPSEKIEDIENVEFVFKDGIGDDSQKLIETVRGAVGLH